MPTTLAQLLKKPDDINVNQPLQEGWEAAISSHVKGIKVEKK